MKWQKYAINFALSNKIKMHISIFLSIIFNIIKYVISRSNQFELHNGFII
jgi:hypothetical protein